MKNFVSLKALEAFCLSALYYALAMVASYTIAMLALQWNITFPLWPFREFQIKEYFGSAPIIGTRRIWQSDPECAVPDDYLIYKPKIGVCKFANLEYTTTLTFDDFGRVWPERGLPIGNEGIVILGDSHAMGWGVNDGETFSALLKKITKRPVYNLAVSSYGTRRELRRLLRSGLLDRVTTIVIQYCDNDLGENRELLTDARYSDLAKDFRLSQSRTLIQPTLSLREEALILSHRLSLALNEPVEAIGRFLFGTPLGDLELHYFESPQDFNPHYVQLLEVLREYLTELKGKKIVIFYSNQHGRRFKNFPNGKDWVIDDVYYFQPKLERSDYYAIDDHLNASGHKNVGEQLATFLNKIQVAPK